MDTFTVWLIIVGGSATALFMLRRSRQAAEAERRAAEWRKAQVITLAEKAQSACARLDDAKTATSQVNQAKRALSYLEEAATYPECREVIKNYDHMLERLAAIVKVAPIIEKVEKAYRHKFKGSAKSELNALLDALYEIRSERIGDRDIAIAEMYPSGTGEIVSVKAIERRCRELGWTG